MINHNTIECLSIQKPGQIPDFNYGADFSDKCATIKSQAGLNSYKLSVKEWAAKTRTIIKE